MIPIIMRNNNSNVKMLHLMFLSLLICLLRLTNGQGEPTLTMTCPTSNGKLSPVTLATTTLLTIEKTNGAGSLCTLTLEFGDNGLFIPIARSYDGNDWERAGGTFAASLEEWVCNGSSCSARVPAGAKYVLQTRSSTTTNTAAQVARFLESASFGARPSDLTTWNGKTFAAYVKEQVSLPMTLHRESFRKQTNPRWTFHKPEFAAALDPCAPNSTWRRQVLTTLDRNKKLNVRKVGDRWEVSIDGRVRTMVRQLRFVNAFKWQNDTVTDGAAYDFCSSEEQIRRALYYVRINGSCRPLVTDDLIVDFPDGFVPSASLQGVLPAISSTAQWLKTSPRNPEYMYQGAITTTRSLSSTRSVSTTAATGQKSSSLLGGSRLFQGNFFAWLLRLLFGRGTPAPTSPTVPTASIPSAPSPTPPTAPVPTAPTAPSPTAPNPSCQIVNAVPSPTPGGSLLFAKTSDGIWLQHDPRIDMETNSISSPLPDGGNALLQAKKTLYCSNAPRSFFNEGQCVMSSIPACRPGSTNASAATTGTIVCGSSGEITNDLSLGDNWLDISSIDTDRSAAIGLPADITSTESFSRQREFIWSDVALNAKDQLRQRIAFALMYIFSLPKLAISQEFRMTEIFLQYYDIFVRNAFGNYFDILKEISFSAMNAESLSYVDSRSVAAAFQSNLGIVYPDENYARELMQLFVIGLFELNMDGTPKFDLNGVLQTYDSDDILSFARAWTGFRLPARRANTESPDSRNRLDPMRIDMARRDRFPKTDLFNGYIGDYYPLCIDLPGKTFLRMGAKYRLLGSSPTPELRTQTWIETSSTQRLNLQSSSSLYQALCTPSSGSCTYPSVVLLDSNLVCDGLECSLDTVQIVQVGTVFYEYIRIPCVEQPFFMEGAKVTGVTRDSKPVCTHPLLPVAAEACCDASVTLSYKKYAIPACTISGERMTRDVAQSRCAAVNRVLCDYYNVTATPKCPFDGFYWTSQSCIMRVKVTNDGQAVVVHDYTYTASDLRKNTPNYFKVYWEGNVFPTFETGCGGGQCEIYGESCVCNITVTNEPVFTAPPANAAEILQQLRIGHAPPSLYDSNTYVASDASDYRSYSTTQSCCGKDTFFEVKDRNGQTKYLRNLKSTVQIVGTSFQFRNPPQFNSFLSTEYSIADANFETEAVLNHLFYHPNTAPFVAYRFCQRFGVSNPTPRYVLAVAKAFQTGQYSDSGESFGSGKYGDMEATIAAVLLDREARAMVLDADPAQGLLKEPILKALSFMRATDFKSSVPLLELDYMDLKVGQMAYEQGSVFSFFRPEYSPSELAGTGLTSPESQLMSSSNIIGILNGLFALVKYGLNECNSGFGAYGDCSTTSPNSGNITYLPSTINDPTAMVQELSNLLTGGRLTDAKRQTIVNSIAALNATKAYQMALQLIASSPEFHSTSRVDPLAPADKPPIIPTDTTPPTPGYKAVIHLALRGGCDSFNVLVPASTCVPLHQEYADVRGAIGLTPAQTLPLTGNAGGNQPCDSFTIHSGLPFLKSLYDSGDLAFLANVGVLTQYVNKTDYQVRTKTPLFSHNSMQDEINKLDPIKKFGGTGTLGRLADVLQAQGFMTGRTSVDAPTMNLASRAATTPPIVTLSQKGVSLFNVDPASPTMNTVIQQLNNGVSGVYGDLWSTLLKRALNQTDELYGLLKNTVPTTVFPTTSLGNRMKIMAQMIANRVARGVERDFYFVPLDGFDTHNAVQLVLEGRFLELNEALEDFVTELKTLGVWDDVVIVQTSDFGRTITGNSGGGTDHGWGGNYWLAGGSVQGQRIVGKYPSTFLTGDDIPLNLDRGRIIPTTSWDSIFHSIANWMGVSTDAELNAVLPNRNKFSDLFTKADLFIN
jgi:uncharacterized protein (DUF1501 family)/uncharacterized protein (DUF1800 family)